MSDKFNQELITTTIEFLDYIDLNKTELQGDKYLFSSFLEICKVLESSIKVIEIKIERRKNLNARKQSESLSK